MMSTACRWLLHHDLPGMLCRDVGESSGSHVGRTPVRLRGCKKPRGVLGHEPSGVRLSDFLLSERPSNQTLTAKSPYPTQKP